MSSEIQRELTFEEMSGQAVMPRIDFNKKEDIERAFQLVDKYKVAGFIIFNGEIEKVSGTTAKLQSESEIPLLFGCDAERGLGQIVEGGTKFPFLMSQGAAGDKMLLEQQAEITAMEMKYCGLNLLFAPVLDINTNPDNPIINTRSFSDDKNVVSDLGVIFFQKIKESFHVQNTFQDMARLTWILMWNYP